MTEESTATCGVEAHPDECLCDVHIEHVTEVTYGLHEIPRLKRIMQIQELSRPWRGENLQELLRWSDKVTEALAAEEAGARTLNLARTMPADELADIQARVSQRLEQGSLPSELPAALDLTWDQVASALCSMLIPTSVASDSTDVGNCWKLRRDQWDDLLTMVQQQKGATTIASVTKHDWGTPIDWSVIKRLWPLFHVDKAPTKAQKTPPEAKHMARSLAEDLETPAKDIIQRVCERWPGLSTEAIRNLVKKHRIQLTGG